MTKGRRDSRDDVSASGFQPRGRSSIDECRSAHRRHFEKLETFGSILSGKPPPHDALDAILRWETNDGTV
jgi:hypothetical protein